VSVAQVFEIALDFAKRAKSSQRQAQHTVFASEAKQSRDSKTTCAIDTLAGMTEKNIKCPLHYLPTFQEPLHFNCRHTAEAGGSYRLPIFVVLHITGSKNPGDIRCG